MKPLKKVDLLTAGLARIFVRGYNLVPAPPPRMTETTDLGSALGLLADEA